LKSPTNTASQKFPTQVFWTLIVTVGIVILATFKDYGITADEESHIVYGQSVVKWYTSGFSDRRIFSWTNTWLYGGFYDGIVYILMEVSPLSYFDTRHLCNAITGLLGIIAAYRIGCLLGNRWTGLLAGLFLILTPRYYGHAFNNHKDLPFAVLYLWSLYWQIKILRHLPHVRWRWVVITGLVTGLAMGIRVGGIVLVGYAGLFWGAHYLKTCMQSRTSIGSALKAYVAQIFIFSIVAYVVMLIFWPWAQTGPLTHPFKALMQFSQFPIIQISFFEGQHVLSTQIPWYYAPKWIALTLPEFIWTGLFAGLIYFIKYRKKRQRLSVLPFFLLAFSLLLPLAYCVITATPLYNGIRHLLFVIPPLIILSAFGTYSLITHLSLHLRRIAVGALLLLFLFTLREMVILHPNQYVYFNTLFAGGIEKANHLYETDYWHNSQKQAIQWLTNNNITQYLHRKPRIASSTSTTRFLLPPHFDYVENLWKADYYLTTATFENHEIIGDVAHVVRRKSAPLLYIIQPDISTLNSSLILAETRPQYLEHLSDLYEKANRQKDALSACQKGLKINPQQLGLHIKIGNLYLKQQDYRLALSHYQTAATLEAPDTDLLLKIGRCHTRLGQVEQAETIYKKALHLRPYFLQAHGALGNLYLKQNRNKEAISHFQQILDIEPKNPTVWFALAQTHRRLNNPDTALQALNQFINLNNTDTRGWLELFELGKIYQSKGDPKKAKSIFQRFLEQFPEHAEVRVHLKQLEQSQ